MPKESRKRSRSKSPSSKKSRDRRSPARDRDNRDRDRERERRDRRRSRSRDRRRREDRKRRSKSNSRSASPPAGGAAATGNGSSSSSSSAAQRAASKSKSRGNSLGPTAPGLNIEGALKVKDEGPLDNEAEQKRLETEMQKRRERIEKWRAEKKARDLGLIPGGTDLTAIAEKKEPTPAPKAVKKWNLSDDEEDDDDVVAADGDPPPTKAKKEAPRNGTAKEAEVKAEVKEESEDEVDPLDAYMMGIQKEVKKIGNKAKPIVIKGGVAKKTGVTGSAAVAADSAKETKMDVDPVEVKKESDAAEVKKEEADETTETTAPKDTADAPETNGEIKPLLDFKRAKKVVTIISGVATKKADAKKKGTLMEQNQDALEYSSEEEDESKPSSLSWSKKKKIPAEIESFF